MLGLYTAYLKSLLVPKKRQFTDTQLFALIKKYIYRERYIDIYMIYDYCRFIIITSYLSEIVYRNKVNT